MYWKLVGTHARLTPHTSVKLHSFSKKALACWEDYLCV